MSETNKDLIRRYQDAWNRGDIEALEGILETLLPRCERQTPGKLRRKLQPNVYQTRIAIAFTLRPLGKTQLFSADRALRMTKAIHIHIVSAY